jgi:hypothetical protein
MVSVSWKVTTSKFVRRFRDEIARLLSAWELDPRVVRRSSRIDPAMPAACDARKYILTTLPTIFLISAPFEPRCGVPKKTMPEVAESMSRYRWSSSCARTRASK